MTDKEIRVTITLPGVFTVTLAEELHGDNPSFYSKEIDRALKNVSIRARRVLAAEYGAQR